MPQQCPKPDCGLSSPDAALYCQFCGATLAATHVQCRTVLAPADSPPPRLTMATVHEVTQRLERVLPAGVSLGQSQPAVDARRGKREETASVIDHSWSMKEPYNKSLPKLEGAVMANIHMVTSKEAIDPDDEIALIAFNSRAKTILSLRPIRTHKTEFIRALQSLTPDNGTDINEGLKAARDVFDWSRRDVVRRVVLLTDGEGGDPLRTAQDLKSRGVVIDVVGVGPAPSRVNEKLLRAVASVVEGEVRYRFIEDFGTLVTHYQTLGNKTAVQP